MENRINGHAVPAQRIATNCKKDRLSDIETGWLA
jgi:hypothetical protein